MTSSFVTQATVHVGCVPLLLSRREEVYTGECMRTVGQLTALKCHTSGRGAVRTTSRPATSSPPRVASSASFSFPRSVLYHSVSPSPVDLSDGQIQMNSELLQSTSTSSFPKPKMRPRFLRLYSSDGQRSTRIECDEQMTCATICHQFSCDVITLQIGNYHFR